MAGSWQHNAPKHFRAASLKEGVREGVGHVPCLIVSGK